MLRFRRNRKKLKMDFDHERIQVDSSDKLNGKIGDVSPLNHSPRELELLKKIAHLEKELQKEKSEKIMYEFLSEGNSNIREATFQNTITTQTMKEVSVTMLNLMEQQKSLFAEFKKINLVPVNPNPISHNNLICLLCGYKNSHTYERCSKYPNEAPKGTQCPQCQGFHTTPCVKDKWIGQGKINQDPSKLGPQSRSKNPNMVCLLCGFRASHTFENCVKYPGCYPTDFQCPHCTGYHPGMCMKKIGDDKK